MWVETSLKCLVQLGLRLPHTLSTLKLWFHCTLLIVLVTVLVVASFFADSLILFIAKTFQFYLSAISTDN
jgi:hypothetical protein